MKSRKDLGSRTWSKELIDKVTTELLRLDHIQRKSGEGAAKAAALSVAAGGGAAENQANKKGGKKKRRGASDDEDELKSGDSALADSGLVAATQLFLHPPVVYASSNRPGQLPLDFSQGEQLALCALLSEGGEDPLMAIIFAQAFLDEVVNVGEFSAVHKAVPLPIVLPRRFFTFQGFCDVKKGNTFDGLLLKKHFGSESVVASYAMYWIAFLLLNHLCLPSQQQLIQSCIQIIVR